MTAVSSKSISIWLSDTVVVIPVLPEIVNVWPNASVSFDPTSADNTIPPSVNPTTRLSTYPFVVASVFAVGVTRLIILWFV